MKPLMYYLVLAISLFECIVIYLTTETGVVNPFVELPGSINALAIILTFQLTNKYHKLLD